MTPREIYLLKRQSPVLQHAFSTHRDQVWHFLTQNVRARFGYYPQGSHVCERCQKVVYPTLKSPYNAFHPGWCIECVLQAFLSGSQDFYYQELEIFMAETRWLLHRTPH